VAERKRKVRVFASAFRTTGIFPLTRLSFGTRFENVAKVAVVLKIFAIRENFGGARRGVGIVRMFVRVGCAKTVGNDANNRNKKNRRPDKLRQNPKPPPFHPEPDNEDSRNCFRCAQDDNLRSAHILADSCQRSSDSFQCAFLANNLHQVIKARS